MSRCVSATTQLLIRTMLIAFTMILTIVWSGSLCAAEASSANNLTQIGSGAERTEVFASDARRPSSNRNNSGTGFQLFDYVVHLLRRHYVREIPNTLLFDMPLKKMMMTFLPNCVEDIPDFDECSAGPAKCFAQSIRSIASRCHIRQDRLIEIALNYVLRDLDPNTGLLNETMLKEIKISTSGKFGGVGLVVASREGDYVVVSPFEGSPAHRIGIKPGEIVLEIDGRPVQGLPLSEVLGKVRGPAGSTITFTLKDPKSNKIRHVRLRRKEIVVPPVRYGMPVAGIGYLRLINFQESTYIETERALKQIMSGNGSSIRGLILDLRDNPGGLFDQAILVADLFLPSGVITSLRGHNNRLNREFRADSRAFVPRIPIVVLVNNGTASASEILAGALKGKPGVVLMGRRTFGKASVQAVFPLKKGLALRLTTAHYYTADGADIEGKGLEPDIRLEDTNDNLVEGTVDPLAGESLEKDHAVTKAVEYILSSPKPEDRPFRPLF
jgi:carboxyl-terminal processing protease